MHTGAETPEVLRRGATALPFLLAPLYLLALLLLPVHSPHCSCLLGVLGGRVMLTNPGPYLAYLPALSLTSGGTVQK